jgi:predicted O-methyltransferase YrrM
VVDAGREARSEHLEIGLRLVRPGGSVLVPHVLRGDRTADPVERDADRALLTAVREREDLLSGLSIVGDGLLHIVRR